MSIPSQVQSGAITAVKLTALGTNGRVARSYDLTANLSSSNGALFYSDSAGTTAATSVTFSSGTATVYVKFVNSGSQTITAKDQTTNSIAGSAGTFVTVPDPVTQYAMTLNPTVVSGSPTTVTDQG